MLNILWFFVGIGTAEVMYVPWHLTSMWAPKYKAAAIVWAIMVLGAGIVLDVSFGPDGLFGFGSGVLVGTLSVEWWFRTFKTRSVRVSAASDQHLSH
jgi:hypothetical protein